MAAQSTATNDARARVLPAWMARATTSFPVPDSPVISTVRSVGATRPIISEIRFMGGLTATSSARACAFVWGVSLASASVTALARRATDTGFAR